VPPVPLGFNIVLPFEQHAPVEVWSMGKPIPFEILANSALEPKSNCESPIRSQFFRNVVELYYNTLLRTFRAGDFQQLLTSPKIPFDKPQLNQFQCFTAGPD
jgi:hypothetical protein